MTGVKIDLSHRWDPAANQIDVQHVVIHYTAETLDETLRLFAAPERRVGAHLVIGPDGQTFEISPFSHGRASVAPHAGRSRWVDAAGREWTDFNDHSIGIELVNPNGNVIDYTDRQYQALADAIRLISERYPAVDSPERILGHEQISGWRGKVDPGRRFDWSRLFREVFPGAPEPERRPACPDDLGAALQRFVEAEPPASDQAAEHWRAVNYFLERVVAHLNGGKAAV